MDAYLATRTSDRGICVRAAHFHAPAPPIIVSVNIDISISCVLMVCVLRFHISLDYCDGISFSIFTPHCIQALEIRLKDYAC
jgi:hypothetical protein